METMLQHDAQVQLRLPFLDNSLCLGLSKCSMSHANFFFSRCSSKEQRAGGGRRPPVIVRDSRILSPPNIRIIMGAVTRKAPPGGSVRIKGICLNGLLFFLDAWRRRKGKGQPTRTPLTLL